MAMEDAQEASFVLFPQLSPVQDRAFQVLDLGVKVARPVHGCCTLFCAVSMQRETAKLLIEIGNYAAVSLFRCFGKGLLVICPRF